MVETEDFRQKKKRQCDYGDRDWSDVAINQKYLQKLETERDKKQILPLGSILRLILMQ